MSSPERFMEYVLAFEEAYASDDWDLLVPFFTEDAVYEASGGPPFGGRREGRPAVLAWFRQVTGDFDRRFDSRTGDLLEGPLERDAAIWIRWAGIYTVAGVEPLRIEGEERAYYEGDRIKLLADSIEDSVAQYGMAYLAAHDGKLKPAARTVS